MLKDPETLCVENGDIMEPFLTISNLPGSERSRLKPDSPVVKAAAKICQLCPNFDACSENLDFWLIGKQRNWPEPGESQLPAVQAGRLIYLDAHEIRDAETIELESLSLQSLAVIAARTSPKSTSAKVSPPGLSPGSDTKSPAKKPRKETSKSAVELGSAVPQSSGDPGLSGGGNSRRRGVDPDEDLVRLYLREIARHKLISKDDEELLAQTIERGKEAAERADLKDLPASERVKLKRLIREGEEANTKFIQANLRLVVSIAKHYQASGLPLIDLIQDGNLGLMHAVKKFDWRKGFKFSTYSMWWIRQSIVRGIADNGRAIRLPVRAGDKLKRIQKARDQLNQTLRRQPTIAEIAENVGMSLEHVTEALLYGIEPLSLSEPVGSEGESELGDLVADRVSDDTADQALRYADSERVHALLASLDDPRVEAILRSRFGLNGEEPKTLNQVGEDFNLTRQRIKQLEKRALNALRHSSAEDLY